jgi:hypothetical protein
LSSALQRALPPTPRIAIVRTSTVLPALLLVAVGVAACAHPDDPPPVPPSPRVPAAFIIDADAHGAIVFDTSEETYLGVLRDGTRAWEAPGDQAAPLVVGCAARCPDAALSGSVRSLTETGEPDPEPRLILDGEPQPAPGEVAGHHRRLLTVTTPEDYVAATGDGDGRWEVTVHRPSHAPTSMTVQGGPPTWQQSAGGQAALLTVTGSDAGTASEALPATPGDDTQPPAGQAHRFTRQAGGWVPAGEATPIAGSSACVADDGRGLLLGQTPAILHPDGRQEAVTDLEHASACALTRFGGIVAELAQSLGGGPQARIRALGADGQDVWGRDIAGEAAVAADPTGPRAAWTAEGVLQEIDLRTGEELQVLSVVEDARYDGAGALVTVGPGNTVTWHPAGPAGRS